MMVSYNLEFVLYLQRSISTSAASKLLVVKTGNLSKFTKFSQSLGQNVIKCALLGSFLAIYEIKDSTTKHYWRNSLANSALSKLFNGYFQQIVVDIANLSNLCPKRPFS